MRLVKKVRGTVNASESFRGKLVKTIGEEASCCKTSCIYRGGEDQSFSIRSSSKSKMACAKRVCVGVDWHEHLLLVQSIRSLCLRLHCIANLWKLWFLVDSRRCFATSSSYHRVNRESKRLDRVLVVEIVVTEEIIEEGNRWSSIEIEEVRMKASQCGESCFKAIEGNAKEYQIRSTDISRITRKQSKNEQARTRESEDYKKKPKDQSRSQKSQASVKD
ncbi:hypothetical protein Tco_0053839, partial [Tanacetum coccineum]